MLMNWNAWETCIRRSARICNDITCWHRLLVLVSWRVYSRVHSSGSGIHTINSISIYLVPLVVVVKPFFMRDFFRGCKERFFCFHASFCPVKRGNRAGSSRNESSTFGEVPRSASRFSRVAVARIPDYLIFQLCSQKTNSWSKRGFCWINFFVVARKLKNELVRNSRNCDNRKAINWSGYLSESSQLILRRAGSISSLYRAETNLKAAKTL